MNIRKCKGCTHYSKLYDRDGKPCNHWCIAKNGIIKNFPKECKYYEGDKK